MYQALLKTLGVQRTLQYDGEYILRNEQLCLSHEWLLFLLLSSFPSHSPCSVTSMTTCRAQGIMRDRHGKVCCHMDYI